MISLAVLFISLAFLLLIVIATSDNILLTPQFAFVALFVASTGYGLFYVDYMELNMAMTTFFSILGGNVLFWFVSFTVYRFSKKMHIQRNNDNYTSAIIETENIKMIIMLTFQIVTFFLIFIFLIKNYKGNSFAATIFNYRNAALYNTKYVAMPRYIKLMRAFSIASGYIWCYLLAHQLVFNYSKNRILLIVNLILTLIINVILGGRGGTLNLLISAVVMWYIMFEKKTGWEKKYNIKIFAKMIVLAFIVLMLFQIFGNFLGRNSSRGWREYIANYLSFEIKNLDNFIRRGKFGTTVNNWQTLIYVINYVANRFGIDSLYHTLDIPYQFINGRSLGNVATTFYSFLYDGGAGALVFFVIVMATISQKLLCCSLKAYCGKKNHIDMYLISYAYIYPSIAFSFFSNKFYEDIFNIAFVHNIIFILILRFFLQKIQIKR